MLDELYCKLEIYKEALEKFRKIDRKKLFKTIEDVNCKEDIQSELLKKFCEVTNALNEFNSALLVYHPVISKNVSLKEYSKFYNNLIMSKMKYFFFKEKDPKKSLSDIDKDFVENIYKIAKKIVVLNDEDELKRALANYYFFAFLLFHLLVVKL